MNNLNPHPKHCPTCAERRAYKTNREPIDWEGVHALRAWLPNAPLPLLVDYIVSAKDFQHAPNRRTLRRFLSLAKQLDRYRAR